MRKDKKEQQWVEVKEGDIYTYPAVQRSLELVCKPGALYPQALWYVHAFGIRMGIRTVYVPLLRKDILIENIEKWRISPYG